MKPTNIRGLAESFLESAHYWSDYANSTFCPRRVARAVELQERYFRAYHYIVDRIETADAANAAWRRGDRTA